jgi:CBS domain-containing protein
MSHATNNPSSNKKDAARMGPNASRGAGGAGSRGMGQSANDDTRRAGPGTGSTAGGARTQKVCDVMTRDVRIVAPDQTLREAATMMADADVGSLPVGENDRLIGMITDRDIVLRAVADGRHPDTAVRDVMTDRIQYCRDDETVDEVARHMAELGVRRLPVIDRDKRLVGIVALSNIAQCPDTAAKEEFLGSVAAPH